MNRSDHLQWAKNRAFEYLEIGDVNNAWASFLSDMGKHEELKDHHALKLGFQLFMMGNLSTPAKMKKFIEDFN